MKIAIFLLCLILTMSKGSGTPKCDKTSIKFMDCLKNGYKSKKLECPRDSLEHMKPRQRKMPCRRIERAAKKCGFKCPVEEDPGPIVGGWTDVVVDSKIGKLTQYAVTELVRRGVKQLTGRKAVILGDVIEAETQVVAGWKYHIVLHLGITTEPACLGAATQKIVKIANCPGADLKGKYKFTLIERPWMTPVLTVLDFEDIEGPALRKKLWGE